MKLMIFEAKRLKEKIMLLFREMEGPIALSGELNKHLDSAIQVMRDYKKSVIEEQKPNVKTRKRYQYGKKLALEG